LSQESKCLKMKKISMFLALVLALALSGCYDDSAIIGRVSDLEGRVKTLEDLCKEINTNISSLQTIVAALQQNDYVTSVTPIKYGGEEIGYTISFTKSGAVTIYHGKEGADGLNGADGKDGTDGKDGAPGKDGEDGKDGVVPVIGLRADADGVYYWTANGEWLRDGEGNKVCASGLDGQDGADGAPGKDGTDGMPGQDGADGLPGQAGNDGQDGVTPQLKIENGWWYVSYDNGASWAELGKATGEDGADGEPAPASDSIFKDVDVSDPAFVVFVLADGTRISIPTWASFAELKQTVQQMNTNIEAMYKVLEAYESNDWITNVSPLMEEGKQVGYTISFAKAGVVTIYHGRDGAAGEAGQNGADGLPGKDGDDGKDGVAPVIGLRADADGVYYWTVDGEWLLDGDGNKVRASGLDGKDGADGMSGQDGVDGLPGQDGSDGQDGADGLPGKDGVTPQLKIENDLWYVSYDDGVSWIELGKAKGEDGAPGQDGTDGVDGAPGKDGDAFFQGISETETEVVFTLADGTSFTVLKNKPFSISFDTDDICFSTGCSYTVNYTINGADELTSMQVMTSDGLTASFEQTALEDGVATGVITVKTPYEIVERTSVAVLVSDGRSKVIMKALNFVYEGSGNIEEGVLVITAAEALTAEAAGGVVEVPLQTNMNYRVEIAEESSSWLTLAPAVKSALREETISLTAAPNSGGQRNGFVYLINVADNSLIQTVCITQKADETALSEAVIFNVPAFETQMVNAYDTDGDGVLSKNEALEIESITANYSDLTGIEAMANLKSLTCPNYNLTTIDLSGNPLLENLDLSATNGKLRSLDVSHNRNLKALDLSGTAVSTLDLTSNKELVSIDVGNNSALKIMNVSGLAKLATINCYQCTSLTSLNLSGCASITYLNLPFCKALASLNVDDCVELAELRCETCPLRSLNLDNNPKLKTLDLSSTQISSLNLSNNPMLASLDVTSTPLSYINLGNLRYISSLELTNLNTTSLTVQAANVKTLNISSASTTSGSCIEKLDISSCRQLQSLTLGTMNINCLDLAMLKDLRTLILTGTKNVSSLDLSENTELGYLQILTNQYIETLDLSKNTGLATLDLQGVTSLKSLDLSNNLKIKTLDLTYMDSLEYLNIGDNVQMTNFSFGCIGAEKFKIIAPNLTEMKSGYKDNYREIYAEELDITECPNLTLLSVDAPNLKKLALSNNMKLASIEILDGNLTELDASGNENLTMLRYNGSELEYLNVTGCVNLNELYVYNNRLRSLDVSTNSSLTSLNCSENLMETLDVSGCSKLTTLDCSPMETLETLYVGASQKINYVTYNRSDNYVPAATVIQTL